MTELSLAAVDLLWEHLGLDTPPVIFQIPSVGTTLDERARIRETEFAALTRRGLMHHGKLDRELTANLTLLNRPRTAIESLAVLAGDNRLCARAATNGRRAVLAVLDQETLHLQRIRPTALITAVLNLIGPAHPGPGRSVTYPTAAPEPTTLLHTATPTAESQRQQAHTILAQPRTQTGIFIVLTRDRHNRETTHPALLWFDTKAGRYLGHITQSPDGQTWTTYTPADTARLTNQLSQLVKVDFS